MYFMDRILETASDLIGVSLSQVNGMIAVLMAIIAIVGLFNCFFGYKIMRVLFAVAGLGIGGVGGLAIGFLSNMSFWMVILLGVLFGVLGALLLFHVYKLGVFCMNGGLAFMILVLLLGAHRIGEFILCAAFACIAGIVSVLLVRVWTILSTGICGGLVAGIALGMIFGNAAAGIVLAAVLAVLGILYQFKSTAKNTSDRESAKSDAASDSVASDSAAAAPVLPAPVNTVEEIIEAEVLPVAENDTVIEANADAADDAVLVTADADKRENAFCRIAGCIGNFICKLICGIVYFVTIGTALGKQMINQLRGDA